MDVGQRSVVRAVPPIGGSAAHSGLQAAHPGGRWRGVLDQGPGRGSMRVDGQR